MERLKKEFFMEGLGDRQKLMVEKVNEIVDHINALATQSITVDTAPEYTGYDPSDIPGLDVENPN